ncbi:MAG: DUF5916 domain-containing protein [Bacteroidales bacterium]
MIKQPRTLVCSIVVIFSLFVINRGLHAQAESGAIYFEEPPRIDGVINEACWQQTQPITEFVQREPLPGIPATVETEIYIGYDSENLYVAFRCLGEYDEISAKQMARDVDLSNDDRVQLILDTYLDKRNGYWFQIGPRGSIGDAIISENGAAFNKAWDGLWSGKATMHDQGWDAEIAIPFKTLNFDREATSWGLKIIRYQKSREETVYWPVANINTHKFQVSDAGILTGLKGISQGVGLDLVPYGLGGIDFNESDPGPSPVLDGGFEAYYNITSSLKAAISLNTDFAQTEVDQQEINLTRFSLFYPEKRDFFLDGANYFNFGINGDQDNRWNTRMIPFFSRRIGLDANGKPIPVRYGGKITGQSGKWNIGAMYMNDERDSWKNGNFAVTRISRNLGKQSQIGMISTFGNALYDTSNLVVGMDLKLATSQFRGDKNLSFSMYGLKSVTDNEITGTTGANRDLSYGAEFVYPNDNLSFRIGHMQIRENFIAGIGFVPRPGVKQYYGEITVGYRPEMYGILQVLSGGGLDHVSNFNNKLLTREWFAMPLKLRFLTGEEFQYKVNSTFEFLESPFTLYSNYVIHPGSYSFLWHNFSIKSAQKRQLWGSVNYRFGNFYDGSRKETGLKAGFQVMVPVYIGGEIVRNNIILPESSFTADVYRLNLNLLFSPDITLYSFIQYDSQSDKMGWQSRFQWILKPGREIFLVWNSITRDPFERFQMEEAGARFKIKYAIRF